MKIRYYIIAYKDKQRYYVEEKNNHFYLTKEKNEAAEFIGNIFYDKYQNQDSVFNYLKNKNKDIEFTTELIPNF